MKDPSKDSLDGSQVRCEECKVLVRLDHVDRSLMEEGAEGVVVCDDCLDDMMWEGKIKYDA